MASSDSNVDAVATRESEEDADADDDSEFLGAGPEEALEKNPSAEEAFSPE